MNSFPKHYLADVPQELRLKVLDLCVHRHWHDALDLLHQNGFTQYEWYELVWFHDHAPTNLPDMDCGGSTPLSIAPDSPQRLDQNLNAEPTTLTTSTATLTPNLNAKPRTANPEPIALTPLRASVVKLSPVKVPKPRSKIARLPRDIQTNLNTMLSRGCPYAEIIRCLNDHGYPGFNKVNLHTWKQTGLLKWQRTANPEVLEGHQNVSEGVQKPVEGGSR